MKGGEADRATAPLSLSPPAGPRGLWEGLLRWHLRKFLLQDGADFQNSVKRTVPAFCPSSLVRGPSLD